jgi:2-keto-4-pentenoate hydratase/2-oxohepta-3-ene-1,7-dioic acid hydratase in catechol pathway
MKIVRFEAKGAPAYGILEKDRIKVLSGNPLESLKTGRESVAAEDVRLLAPCTPSKIVAAGVNYRSHAQEMGSKLPASPIIFLKPPTSVIGPDDKIVYPPSCHQLDYEGELAVVIGKTARRVSKEEARSYIFGYTCVNDVTARDLQRSDGQWTRAKSFDTFCPIGPCIETELDDTKTPIDTLVNSTIVQSGNSSDLVFGVPELIAFASEVMTLLPGDIIATGTPGGIGPMKVGDTVEVRIGPIGTLRNHVVSGL